MSRNSAADKVYLIKSSPSNVTGTSVAMECGIRGSTVRNRTIWSTATQHRLSGGAHDTRGKKDPAARVTPCLHDVRPHVLQHARHHVAVEELLEGRAGVGLRVQVRDGLVHSGRRFRDKR